MDKKNSSTPKSQGAAKDCWDTWSRCTGWSSAGTGVLWKNCDDRCKELGKSGGKCVMAPSTCPLTSNASQCQCRK